jgi:hypothetical protein
MSYFGIKDKGEKIILQLGSVRIDSTVRHSPTRQMTVLPYGRFAGNDVGMSRDDFTTALLLEVLHGTLKTAKSLPNHAIA